MAGCGVQMHDAPKLRPLDRGDTVRAAISTARQLSGARNLQQLLSPLS